MIVLGFRNSPTVIRYAVLDGDSNNSIMSNYSLETKLVFPKAMCTISQKIIWYNYEINRIISTYKPDRIGLKHNENVQSNYSKLQETMYYDAILSLSAAQHSIPLIYFTYKQLVTNSANVESLAESYYGKTTQYWDKQIADAICAARRVLG